MIKVAQKNQGCPNALDRFVSHSSLSADSNHSAMPRKVVKLRIISRSAKLFAGNVTSVYEFLYKDINF